MQRVSVAVLAVLVGLVAFGSAGCVDEAKYNAVLLRNREQEKLIQEKEAQLATLNERVTALQARATDAQRLLEEKEGHLGSVMKERDAVRKAFDELKAAYVKIAGNMGVVPGSGGGLPTAVRLLLKQLAGDYPGVFEYDEATDTLRFNADITFDSGSNVVKPDARQAISKLGGILVSDVARSIRSSIVGHTDNDPVKKPQTVALLKELGKSATNQGLSEARAESVAAILKTAGVEAGRITTKGVGEAQPAADNRTAEGKSRNRRVEIFLTMP